MSIAKARLRWLLIFTAILVTAIVVINVINSVFDGPVLTVARRVFS